MTNDHATPTFASLRTVVLVAGLCLLLAACSGSERPTLVESAGQPVAPTPVPTTAPLSLPPADASLPALAPLPAALIDTPSTEVVAAVEVAEPEASPTPSEPAVVPTEIATVVISNDAWDTCIVNAAASVDATALLDPIATATTTDLSSVQLNSLAAAAASCDLATTALATTDLEGHVASATSCLDAWLASSGGGSVFVGLMSTSWEHATPAWAQGQYVDALDSCFTGVSFAAEVMTVVAADASLIGAFDSQCLATSFDTTGVLRTYAQRLAVEPSAAALTVGLGDTWVLNCANVGQMVAAAAAADGVSLSATTITCIDSELRSSGAVAQLVAGNADTDAIGIATIACLSSSEAAALLG